MIDWVAGRRVIWELLSLSFRSLMSDLKAIERTHTYTHTCLHAFAARCCGINLGLGWEGAKNATNTPTPANTTTSTFIWRRESKAKAWIRIIFIGWKLPAVLAQHEEATWLCARRQKVMATNKLIHLLLHAAWNIRIHTFVWFVCCVGVCALCFRGAHSPARTQTRNAHRLKKWLSNAQTKSSCSSYIFSTCFVVVGVFFQCFHIYIFDLFFARRRRVAAVEEDSSSAPLDYSVATTTTTISTNQYTRTLEMFCWAGGSFKHLSWLTLRLPLDLCMRARAFCSLLYLCLLNIHISMYALLFLLLCFWWLMIMWRRQCRRCGSAEFWELNSNGWRSSCRCQPQLHRLRSYLNAELCCAHALLQDVLTTWLASKG